MKVPIFGITLSCLIATAAMGQTTPPAPSVLSNPPSVMGGAVISPEQLLMLVNERDRLYAAKFDAQEKATFNALQNAKEAVIKAETAAEKRFDSVNEFRNTLKDQQATLAPRAEVEIRFNDVGKQLGSIESRLTLMQGKSDGVNWLWGVFGTVAGLFIGLSSAVGFLRRPVRNGSITA